LDLKDKFDEVLRDAWEGDKNMLNCINGAFESFINQNPKSPEFISLYLDDNLRRGLKGKTDSEIEQTLLKTLHLFKFLSDKDIFERYYKIHLGKRLMTGRSVSDDAERQMLGKLKAESGVQFTRDLEGMMKDVKVSEDEAAEFKKWIGAQPSKPPLELIPQVLTSSFWPISNLPTPCVLPTPLQASILFFERFYKKRHEGRRLTWHPHLGTVDVTISFKSRRHEINLPTLAFVVLSLFEEIDEMSYNEILEATKIPPADLKRSLQSIACAKFKLLLKEPKGREIGEGDKFIFNFITFKSDQHRIKIQPIVAKLESGEQRKETNQKIDEERKLVIEAAIVRVMKSKKAMQNNDLVTEVTRQLSARFQVQPRAIKLTVERLIEKEYLERDESDNKCLRYLA